MTNPQAKDLVLGVDGGGTKTVAWLALRDAAAENEPQDSAVVGRGAAGPSNLHAVGWETARQSLNAAIAAAFAAAKVQPGKTAAACIALAGSGREADRQLIKQWARDEIVAQHIDIVPDALPILAVAAQEGAGVALIAGTGSLAYGRNSAGQTARAGGWGYLLGDEGSAFDVARLALSAVAQSADGRGPATELTAAILQRRQLKEPAELINAIYGAADPRAEIASLADLVVEAAARGDDVALHIVDRAAQGLAELVSAVATKLQLAGEPYSLGLAGGMLVHAAPLRERMLAKLAAGGMAAAAVALVEQPVAGAVILARRLARG